MPSPVATRFFLPASRLEAIPVLNSTPEEDQFLSTQFGYRSLGKRKENKRFLLGQYGIAKDDVKKPLVIILANLFVSPKEKLLLEDLVSGLSELDLHMLVIADKKRCSEDLLKRCLQLDNIEKSMHLALAAGDIVVLPSSASTSLVKSCLDYGTVPVASCKQDYISDYDPTRESGNSFAYTKESAWSVFAATVRALETLKLPYDWQRIQRNGMEG